MPSLFAAFEPYLFTWDGTNLFTTNAVPPLNWFAATPYPGSGTIQHMSCAINVPGGNPVLYTVDSAKNCYFYDPVLNTWTPEGVGPWALPTAALSHALSHKSGGSDTIALDTLAAPTDITALNASPSAHGLLPKLDNTATHYLDGTGLWSAPAGGGGSPAVLTYNGSIGASSAGFDCAGFFFIALKLNVTVGIGFTLNLTHVAAGAQISYFLGNSTNNNWGGGSIKITATDVNGTAISVYQFALSGNVLTDMGSTGTSLGPNSRIVWIGTCYAGPDAAQIVLKN